MTENELKDLLEGLFSEEPAESAAEDPRAEMPALDLEERVRRRALRLETAAEISSAATSILDLDKLLPLAVELIRERFSLYYVGIFLLDQADTNGAKQYAILEAATGRAGQQMMKDEHKLEVGGDSMIGWCMANAKARIALDVAQAGEEAVRFDNPYLPETRSEMALPLLSRGRVLGAMTIQSAQPVAFNQDDITVLQTMADQLANAIENAQLFQERERRITELAIVNEVGQAMSTALGLDALLEVVHLQVSRLFDTTNFYIATYREGSDLWTSAFHLEAGQQQAIASYSVEKGFTGHILRTRQPLLFRNADDILAFARAQGFEFLGDVASSWLGVPLITSDTLVGAMAIQNYEHQNLYDEQDMALFSTIATQVANVMQNLRLLEETRAHAQELEVINEIGRAISSVLDLDILLRQIVDTIKERFGHYFVGILLVDGEELVFRSSSFIGDSDERWEFSDLRLALDGYGMNVAAANSGQPMLANDVRANEHYGVVEGLELVRAELDTPIEVRGRVVGTLTVQSDQLNAFDETDIALLQALANQAGVAIENARLFEETRQQAEEMAVLNELAQALTTRPTVDQVLEETYKGVSRLLDTTNFYIGLYEPERNEVRFPINVSESVLDRKMAVLSADQGITGHIIRTRQSVLIKEDMPGWHEKMGMEMVGEPATSWLGVPLMIGQEVLGVMSIQNYTTARLYDEHDRDLLGAIASQAAIAIQNARLIEASQERAEELSILHQVSLELAQEQHDLDTVLATMTQRIMDLLESDGGGVWLWREQDQELELVITFQVGDVDFTGRRLGPGEGLTGRAFAERKLQIIDDYSTWAGKSAAFEDAPFISGLAAPMIWQAQVVGVLVATRSQRGRPYSANEQNLANLLASQAAAVIQNARLFEQAQAQAQEQAILRQITETVSAALDMQHLLDATLHQTLEILGFDAGLTSLYDEEAGQLVLAAHQNIPKPMSRTFETEGLAGTLCDYVFQTGETIGISDVRQGAPVNVEGVIKNGLLAYLGVPLSAKGRRVGTMCFFDRTAQELQDDELALLEAIGGQVGLGISNVRLFEETQTSAEELTILNEMGQALSAQLDVDAVLYNIYRYASRLMDFSNFYVAFHRPETDEISFPLVVENSEQVKWGARQSGRGLTEYVIRTAEPLLITEDAEGYIRDNLEGVDHIGQDAQSWLGVPLMIGNQVLGIIAVQGYDTPRLYTERHRDLLTAAASQAAIAVQNARLFEETQQRISELTMLSDISQSLAGAPLDAREIAELVCRQFIEKMGLSEASISFPDPLDPRLMRVLVDLYAESGVTRVEGAQETFHLVDYPATARVMETRQPLVVHASDPQADPAELAYMEKQGTATLAIIPLVVKGQATGVIELESGEQERRYTDQELNLVLMMANQAAFALENARLFEETQTRAQRERILREITTRVRASTDTETIMRTAVRELGAALDRPTFVRLGDAEELARPPTAANGDNGDEASRGGE